MKLLFYFLVILLVNAVVVFSLGAQFQQKVSWREGQEVQVDPGEPLYLTPYIRNGQVEKATQSNQDPPKNDIDPDLGCREMSKSELLGRVSYAGFFTVKEAFNSNMYFWFFPSADGNASAPLLLWLQGGPGGSSLFGLFNENGPYMVDKYSNLSLRPWSWNAKNHMLYIDNPVGTGYSFTEKAGLSATEQDVADNLYSCLTQFFTVFSDYQKNDFYLTGESYAGKYVPAIGYKIHMANKNKPQVPINLKGLAIGDGLCDPENMFGYAELAFQFGLLDENEKAFVNSQTTAAVNFIKKKDFYSAFLVFDMLLNGDIFKYGTYFYNVTGSTNYFNVLRQTSPPDFNYYLNYINQPAIRKIMKVGKMDYGAQSETVEKALINDVMDTVRDWLAVLMDNYKVLLYNGQLDLIVGGPLTESFLQVLDWSGKEDYLKTKKKILMIGDDLAGYVRAVKDFYQVIVRGGGHILPFDQPERTYELIELFISGKISMFKD